MKNISLVSLMMLLFACNKPGSVTKYDFINMDVQPDSLTMVVNKDSVVADTTVFTEVLLKVGSNIASKYKLATFFISPIGFFSNNKDTMILPIDIAGNVHVFVSSVKEGLATISATVGNLTREGQIYFLPVATDSLILKVSKDSIAADNYTYAEIQAISLNPDVAKKIKTVTFTTLKGTFSNGLMEFTATVGTDGIAKAYLKYNLPERVIVSAKISGGYTRETIVTFFPSFPDQIFFEADSSLLSSVLNSKTKVTVRLLKYYGKVSEDLFVHLYDSTYTKIDTAGIFINTSGSDANGNITSTYTLNDTSFHGYIYINASFKKPSGEIITGTNRIFIQ